MQIAPRRQGLRSAHQVGTGHRPCETAIQRVQDRRRLVIAGQGTGGVRQVVIGQGLCHAGEQIGAGLGRDGAAHHMQAVRDQGLFVLDQVAPERRYIIRGQVQFACLGTDHILKVRPIRRTRIALAPAVQRGFQLDQPLVEPGLRHGRRQVRDRDRRTPALCQRTLGGVVHRVEIDVRQIADQPVGPAFRAHPALFAGHEFERAVHPEVQGDMRAEIFAQVTVEGAERVGWCEALLEEQTHRVALVAEGGLHADKDIAEMRAQHEQIPAIGLDLARAGTPLRLDLGQMRLACDHVVG